KAGFYETLEPGQWILLGLVIEGGQGLATADDKAFLAAIDGTEEAERHLENQERLEELALANADAAALYKRNLRKGREAALLRVNERFDSRTLRWPKGGAFRIARRSEVRRSPLTDAEREHGIRGSRYFVPFEKGDSSDQIDGHAIGAAWFRENPIVI